MPDGYVKRLICLANSRKFGGRCLAGKELVNGVVGPWIRPVSARESRELVIIERWYGNGREVAVGDIFLMAFSGPMAHPYQVENHVIDPNYHCAFEGKANWDMITGCADFCGGSVWINGISSRYGNNDQIPLNKIANINHSLKYIIVSDFVVKIEREWPEFGNRRTIRGEFSYIGCRYILKITDPMIEIEFAVQPEGRYPLGEVALCISLGEPYKEYAYKLIASVTRRP